MSTPYAGTEGSSGTDTSAERAESKAQTARRRQNAMLRYLSACGGTGATVLDVKKAGRLVRAGQFTTHPLGSEFEHHGTASGTLSILHQAGKIARLTETRDKAHVYVLPEHIDGRGFERYVGNAAKAKIVALDEAVAELERAREDARPVARVGIDFATKVLRTRIEHLAAGS